MASHNQVNEQAKHHGISRVKENTVIRNNIDYTDEPTAEETAYFRAEARAYKYQPPEPRAQPNSPEFRGWGIPPHFATPLDAYDYVLADFRKREANLHFHDPRDERRYVPLHPMWQWHITAAVKAHFIWFKKSAGGQYINRFFEVQEARPFHSGYIYYFKDPDAPHCNPQPIQPGEMRIFRSWERMREPACPGVFFKYEERPFMQMCKAMEKYRSPHAENPREPLNEFNEDIFNWVSESIQHWLDTSKVDIRTPFYKEDRLSGIQWVAEQTNPDGSPTYSSIHRVRAYEQESYHNHNEGPVRAYRLQAVDEKGRPYGEVRWVPGAPILIERKLDYDRRMGATDADIEETYQCRACRKTRTCTPHTGREKVCCNCYAKEVESGTDRPTLSRCTMLPECKGCPDQIRDNTALVNLKQRWNRPRSTGPIPGRPR